MKGEIAGEIAKLNLKIEEIFESHQQIKSLSAIVVEMTKNITNFA